MYPTLARMALDILPIPAASVGVESLFSRAKEVATARRSRLSPKTFEQIECLHYYWKDTIVDYARENEEDPEAMLLEEYEEFVEMEEELAELSGESDVDEVSD